MILKHYCPEFNKDSSYQKKFSEECDHIEHFLFSMKLDLIINQLIEDIKAENKEDKNFTFEFFIETSNELVVSLMVENNPKTRKAKTIDFSSNTIHYYKDTVLSKLEKTKTSYIYNITTKELEESKEALQNLYFDIYKENI